MSRVEKLHSPVLIRTKFSPPRLTRPPVHRESVMQALAAGMARALTLIKTPAGFGKTTVLTSWRQALLEKNQIVAWLTLDQDDNDESRFIDYLSATLAEALGDPTDHTPEFANTGKMVSLKAHLTSIINMLGKIGRDVTLILDDYDKITAPSVHGHLKFILPHIPPNLHIVLAVRADPPIPLSSLRVHDQLVEISTNTMRFEIADTQTFFAKSIAINLSADETRAIHEATEGWVAGLQIATLAITGRPGLNGLISTFPRHARALSDYLAENVLSRIAPDTVAFMLRTSILDRLNGRLCECLSGAADAEEKLEWIVKQNMFLQPLDAEGHWYRYHGLFADFLRAQLKRHLGDELLSLHLRAAEWFSENELWAEAVRHALEAGRVDLATLWLERCAMAELRASRVRTFLGWIQKLPNDAVRQRPRLRVALIWALILTVQLPQAQALMDDVEAQLSDESFPETEELRSVMRAQRVSITSMKDDTGIALELGKKVWAERFPGGCKPDRDFDWVDEAFLNVLIHLYRRAGYMEECRRIGEFYRPNADATYNLFMMSYRAALLSALDIHEGHMDAGARRLEDALRLCEEHAGRRSAAATMLAAALASIYYERNKLDAVEELLADRFDIIDDVCYLEPIQSAYISLARVRMAKGDVESAYAILDRAEALADRRGWLRLQAACVVVRFQLCLSENRQADAGHLLMKLEVIEAESCEARHGGREILTMLQITRARHLIHMRQFGDAAAMLADVIATKEADMPHNFYEVLRLRILYAIAIAAGGDSEATRACMSNIMATAERDNLIRTLVDEGGSIMPLMRSLHSHPESLPHAEYYKCLWQALGIQVLAHEVPDNSAEQPIEAALDAESFSRRELDILDLITQKYSNKEIARSLFITPETVKWHLKNLFKKLGVSDRRLAAQKARQLTPMERTLPPPSGHLEVMP